MGGGLYSFDSDAMKRTQTSLHETKPVNPFPHDSIPDGRAEKDHMRILLKSENELTSSFRLSSFSLGNSVRDDQHLIYYFISHWGLEPRITVNPEISFFEGYQFKYGMLPMASGENDDAPCKSPNWASGCAFFL